MQPLLLRAHQWRLAEWAEATDVTILHVVTEALSTHLVRIVDSATREEDPPVRRLGTVDAVGFALKICTSHRPHLGDLPGRLI
jgi:hypothetical protein